MNIVITGSSSGFGRLTAETLALAGHTVYATMRRSETKNASAATELRALSESIRVVDLDVTEEASVSSAIDEIARNTDGALDVLINNAGRFAVGLEESFAIKDVKELFELNFFGPLRMHKAVLPYMRKRRSGLIIDVSSVVGRFSLPLTGAYCATKSALESLSESLRDEVAALGIDVVLVEPGAFPTKVGNNGHYVDTSALASDYRAVIDTPQKLGMGMVKLFMGDNPPKAQHVADAIAKVVALPPGERPVRVVVDSVSAEPVEALNDAYLRHRQEVLKGFGLL